MKLHSEEGPVIRRFLGTSWGKQALGWLQVLPWMALVSYLSTESFSGAWSGGVLRFWAALLNIPADEQQIQIANLILRKVAHVLEFFVLGFLLHRTLSQDTSGASRQDLGWTLLIGGLFAVINELQQAFTATRGPSLADAALDFTGVLGSQLRFFRMAYRPTAPPVPEP